MEQIIKKNKSTYYNSLVPFHMQTYEIMIEMLKTIHHNFFLLRSGKMNYIRPAYSALYEFYVSILRPILPTRDTDFFDKRFDKVVEGIDFGSKDKIIESTKELLEIEKDIMKVKQQRGLGLIIEKSQKDKGVLSKKYIKPEYWSDGSGYNG
ncbi:MAG TPA: hypothetical protein PLG47_03530 [Candidatus Dojkabacteria bacterium]|nr:hypothetical protein [Candidatus Dojkabacteria bacterium]